MIWPWHKVTLKTATTIYYYIQHETRLTYSIINHTHLNKNKTIVSVIMDFGWTVCTSSL